MILQSAYGGQSRWSRSGAGRSITVMSLMLLIAGVTPALGQSPTIQSAEQGTTPMDQMDMRSSQPWLSVFPTLAPPEVTSPFIRDSKFDAQLRTFYFNRDKYDNTRSEAWAIGGWLRSSPATWPTCSASARSATPLNGCMGRMTATARCC